MADPVTTDAGAQVRVAIALCDRLGLEDALVPSRRLIARAEELGEVVRRGQAEARARRTQQLQALVQGKGAVDPAAVSAMVLDTDPWLDVDVHAELVRPGRAVQVTMEAARACRGHAAQMAVAQGADLYRRLQGVAGECVNDVARLPGVSRRTWGSPDPAHLGFPGPGDPGRAGRVRGGVGDDGALPGPFRAGAPAGQSGPVDGWAGRLGAAGQRAGRGLLLPAVGPGRRAGTAPAAPGAAAQVRDRPRLAARPVAARRPGPARAAAGSAGTAGLPNSVAASLAANQMHAPAEVLPSCLMTDGETAEWEALGPHGAIMFSLIDQWVKVTGKEPPEVEPGSPLAGDARKSPSLRVAHAAWTGVVHSVDHLHALRALLGQAQIVNLGAPYSLVRAALENAATAVWLLEPPQRPERLRRRLKLAHDDAWEEGNVHALLPAKALQDKRTAQERMVEIRALAVKLGLDPSDVAGRLSHEKIIRAVAKTTFHDDEESTEDRLSPEDQAALVWRLCSAFAHGKNWASFSWLERQITRSEAGVHLLRLTGGVERLVTVASFPIALTTRALQLYEQRRRSPYTNGPGPPLS